MNKRKYDAYERHLMNTEYPYETHSMSFCEVEVLSCPLGFWGKDLTNGVCSQSCDRCIKGTCRVSDGHCYTRCQEGYWGDSCNNHCTCEPCDRLNGCPVGKAESDERDKCHSL